MAKSKKKSTTLNLAKLFKPLATKKDLARLATKDQLLTVRKEVWEVKDNLAEAKEQIKFLPTKDDFSKQMSEVMWELKTVREEMTVLTDMKDKVNDHEERLETVEEKLGTRLAA